MTHRATRIILASSTFTIALFAAQLAPGSVADARAGDYSVEVFALSDDAWGALRFNKKTGATWRALNGTWVAITEEKETPPPTSTYAISVATLKGDWAAIRFDTESGRSWHASNGAWIAMPE